MIISEEIAGFLCSPVMLVIGAADMNHRPSVGRGLGVSIVGADQFDVVISRAQWPQTVLDIARNGRVAITAARPADYVSYQVKGCAALRDVDEALSAVASAYCVATGRVLADLGVPEAMVAQWLFARDLVAARVQAREVYVQTPGPSAGTAL